MIKGIIAKASIKINAPVAIVWGALTKPKLIKRYMFGTNVFTDWQVGSSIIWRGEWKGKTYEDKGKIIKFEKERLLQYSHFSPLSGIPDISENYHTVTMELEKKGNKTSVSLSQDNNSTDEEREHSEKNWRIMLESMKKLLEKDLMEGLYD